MEPERRKTVLTKDDLTAIAGMLSSHDCRFKQVSHEDMDNIKRLSEFFTRAERKIMDTLTYFVLATIGGFFWLLYNHGYFKGTK